MTPADRWKVVQALASVAASIHETEPKLQNIAHLIAEESTDAARNVASACGTLMAATRALEDAIGLLSCAAAPKRVPA